MLAKFGHAVFENGIGVRNWDKFILPLIWIKWINRNVQELEVQRCYKILKCASALVWEKDEKIIFQSEIKALELGLTNLNMLL